MGIQRFNTCDRKGNRKGFVILDDDDIASVVAEPANYWSNDSQVDSKALEVTLALSRELDSQRLNGDKLQVYCTPEQGEAMAKVIMKKKKLAKPYQRPKKGDDK